MFEVRCPLRWSDLDAAVELIDDLASICKVTPSGIEVPFAILKHNNACGAAVRGG